MTYSQKLRRINPYNTRTNEVITLKWIGWDESCDELEKMEEE